MTKKTKTRLWICISLLVLNLAFIWGNSLVPAHLSARFSAWVKELLQGMWGNGMPGTPSGDGLLRKFAHFTEFTFLGIWLYWLCSMLGKKPWISFLCGFLAACTDEMIQCFVPGRGPAFRDVMIDTSGVLLGILLLVAGHQLHKYYLKRRTKQ